MRDSRSFVSLRTYAFAFAVVLSPAFMQTTFSCSGDTTLAVLSFEVEGEEQLAFTSGQRNYDVQTFVDTAVVTVQAADPAARVTYWVWTDTAPVEDGQFGVGGGQATLDWSSCRSTLQINVQSPGGSLGHYDVHVNRCAVDFLAGAPVTVSGDSVFAQCTADSPVTGTFAADSEVEPWIAVNPTDPDHLAVAWQQDRYLSGGGCRGHIVSVSFDGGGTWAPSTIPGLTRCSGGAWDRTTDPWLAFAANGDLYAAALSSSYLNTGGAIVVNRSTDGGLTWGDPVVVDETTEPLYNDRETMTADPVDPCTIYVTWTRFASNPPAPGDVLFSRTTDCGATWAAPTIVHSVDPAGIAAQIVVLPDGALLAFFKDSTRTNTTPNYVKRSTDGGLTWPGDPVVIADTFLSGVFSPDGALVRAFSLDVAVNRRSGELYAVWELAFDVALQVALSSSSDGGLTWSPPVRIDDTPPNAPFTLEQAFIPSVEVSDDGTIGVTYYNFENDVAGAVPSFSDYWFVSCHPKLADCAQSSGWGAAVRLTPASFDYALAPLTSGTNSGLFLGDYVGLTSAGNDFFAFFSVTTDTDPANGVFVPIRAQ